MNSDDIKAAVAAHFRYERQFPLVAFEASPGLSCGWGDSNQADVLAVSKDRRLTEVEVKISLSDLKANRGKNEHQNIERGYFKLVHYFWFAVPYDLGSQASLIISDFYPYAGLYTVRGGRVECRRNPKALSKERLGMKEIVRMSFHQSGTLCRLSAKVCKLERQDIESQARIKELEGELKLWKPEVTE